MNRRAFSLLVVLVLGCSYAAAAPVRIRVVVHGGAPLPDVLVILKSLDSRKEIFRALSDSAGRVPERDVAPGIYRVIATCPYGVCDTKIDEFAVGKMPVDIDLEVTLSPTRRNVARVGPSNAIRVEVLDPRGRPAQLADVLVRDPYAEFEQWYKTNNDGEVTVEPLDITVFTVLYNGAITEQTFSQYETTKAQREGKSLVIHLK